MNRIAAVLAVATLFSAGALTQDTVQGSSKKTFFFSQDDSAKMPMNMTFQGNVTNDITIMGAEMASPGETVTGLPYTATEATETTQTLSDGNKIVNKTSGLFARDSQGRTHREAPVGHIGSLEANNHKMVFISDPTTHMQQILQPDGESTTVIRSGKYSNIEPMILKLNSAGGPALKKQILVQSQKVSGSDQEKQNNQKLIKHEDLGTQTIEGVSAQGTRDTETIPAGEIGNERPIEIVSESWYSPDLHATVMRKHSDPRTGETVFKLTEIKRSEPDASLFQVPDDVKVLQLQPKHATDPKE